MKTNIISSEARKSNTIIQIIFLFFLIICFTTGKVIAQNTLITDDPATNIENSAVLKIQSDTKGLLIPRLTKAARQAIVSPADGLLVCQIPDQVFYFYDGAKWETLQSGTDAFKYYASQNAIRNFNYLSANFLVGSVFLPGNTPITQDMLYYNKSKSALRIGSVLNSNAWSEDSIGVNSIGMGLNAKATGTNAVSMGYKNMASGDYSTALGYYNLASGNYSTVLGYFNQASGDFSLTSGLATKSAGQISTAFGNGTQSDSKVGMAVGQYNVGGGDPVSWIGSDPLFEIGNGESDSERDNALTVLKNGDFIIGAYELPKTGLTTKTLMFFDQSKAAFRGGELFKSKAWEQDSLGQNSFAYGYNAKATGIESIAMGHNSKAAGTYSIAMGRNSIASGVFSTSFGHNTRSTAQASSAIGQFNVGSGNPIDWVLTDPLFEIGNGINDAQRSNAITVLKNGDFIIGEHALPQMGLFSKSFMFYDQSKAAFRSGELYKSNAWEQDSIGQNSFAFGYNTKATGTEAMAAGYETNARGLNSIAMGNNTNADAKISMAIGQFNVGGGDKNNWIGSDPLFEIGNGSSNSNKNNALTVLKNGDFIIGGHKLPGSTLVTDTLAFFDRSKAAFRGGSLDNGNEWASSFIGQNSFAYGISPKASGKGATAFGNSTLANGDYATAFGQNNLAYGDYSSTFGSNLTTNSHSALVIGRYNEEIAASSASWDSNDPIFIIGNGTSGGINGNSNRSNALTVLKNGKIGVKTHTPEGVLHIKHNSDSSNPHLVLEETVSDTDYTRSKFTNTTQTEYWTLAGRPDDDTPSSARFNVYYSDKGNIISAYGNGNVRMAYGALMFGSIINPGYRIHLPNNAIPVEGQAIAYSWKTYSDARVKTNVQTAKYGLQEILKLNPVSYLHHSSKFEDGQLVVSPTDQKENIGFIAQEVYDVIKEVVSKPVNEATELWSMDYEKLTPVLVKAIQEQQTEIQEQQVEIQNQEERIDLLEKQLAEITGVVKELAQVHE